MANFTNHKHWVVFPYNDVRHLPLMFSPAVVKNERDQKPRVLCNHSWSWLWSSINKTTIPHSPPKAMPFGGSLPRILYYDRHANPKFGSLKANKNDLKDGFYRMCLTPEGCLQLAVLLPRYEGEPPLFGTPLACTMGWTKSPPTFCTMSKTVCDLANARFKSGPLNAPKHRQPGKCKKLDSPTTHKPVPRGTESCDADLLLALVPGVTPLPPEPEHCAPPSNRPLNLPVNHTDVIVDDFIQLGQGGQWRLNSQRDHLLHAIDEVLDCPMPGNTNQSEAASIKKIRKGGASWCPRKVILGWILDFQRQTRELPPHQKAILAENFRFLSSTSQVSEKKWRQILCQLCFVSQAIPGSAGLFCALQVALNRVSDGRIRTSKALCTHIDAFASLAASLSHRPTHFAKLVPQDPSLLGATDAVKMGMGGVFFDAHGNCFAWKFAFPQDIQNRLVSWNNLDGDLTNSNFEHCGILGQVTLMADTKDCAYATFATGTDNTPTLSRVSGGAISREGATANLCNFACTHQRQHCYCNMGFFLPGPMNVMANNYSCLQHLSDTAFLLHLNQRYLQDKPWRLLHLTSDAAAKLISCLRSRRQASLPQLSPALAKLPSGTSGSSSAPSIARAFTQRNRQP